MAWVGSMRSRRYTAIIPVLVAAGLAGCGGTEGSKSDTRSSAARAEGTDPTTDSGDAKGESNENASGADHAAAAKLWSNSLKPALEKDCSSCHAEPRFPVVRRGPLTIFSYDAVMAMLGDGASALDNKFIRKPLGGDAHGGGVRCAVDEPPCDLIVAIRRLQFGADSSTATNSSETLTLPADADPRSAAVVSVATNGLVVGWAVDKKDLATSLTVKLVLDAPLGMGTLAATTTADRLVDDGKHPGDHGFFVQVPAALRTGVARDLYLYDGADRLLTPSPASFRAFAPREAGRQFFEATVAPLIKSKCNGCHEPAYQTFYNALAGKGPNEGGTATDNNAVNKPGGVAPHTGGNRCGGINGSPCKEFQQWWQLEFE